MTKLIFELTQPCTELLEDNMKSSEDIIEEGNIDDTATCDPFQR